MAQVDKDQETQPLLVVPMKRADAPEKVPNRSWRGHWLQICGLCSPEDVSSCCLAYNVPCIAFGWNLKRGLQLSFWREAVRFTVLTLVIYLMMRCMGMALMMACGPQPMPADMPMNAAAAYSGSVGSNAGGAMMGGMMMGNQGMPRNEYDNAYGQDALVADPEFPMGGDAMHGAWGHHGPHDGAYPDDPMALMDPFCVHVFMTSPSMLLMYALLAATVASTLYYLARRRQQLRQQFGIPGSFLGDCCLWTWCSVCALAQETRTLMHNQVHDGVWYGEVPGAPHAARAGNHYVAPTAGQQMV